MKLRRLLLEQYRNIPRAEVKPCDSVNIICGDNAQGKTNLLEAIWLFTGKGSFRGSRDSEILRFGEENAHLHLDFYAQDRQQSADIHFGQSGKRAFLNEVRQDGVSAFYGVFPAVVFSPDHLSMIKNGPDMRRRFLDLSLSQMIPKYQKNLESYERIVRQRAQLLKDIQYQSSLLDTLGVWDMHLAEYGAYISEVRTRYVRSLEDISKNTYSGITFGRESFSLEYKSTAANALPKSRDGWKTAITDALAAVRAEDLRLGVTTVGPHRDDLYIGVNGSSARLYASQGQQRSCVLALKLAECELIARSVGEQPVVLLDDVLSELDEGRRSYLLNHLEGRQVFITCCDASAFDTLQSGKVFLVRGGSVVPENGE